MSTTKLAICDSEAIYPFRDLVEGRFKRIEDFSAVERFVRTVALHDEIILEIAPMAYDPEAEAESEHDYREIGGKRVRFVITGFGPAINYDFVKPGGLPPADSEIVLSSPIMDEVSSFSNAEAGNPFYEAHIKFAQKALSVVKKGNGSALLGSEFGQRIMGAGERYPEKLFESLDKDWKSFTSEIELNRLGLRVPPVVAIILSRCARRDAIPIVLKDLRDEWADARKKVWKLIDSLQTCNTVREIREISRELTEASNLFSPKSNEFDSRPGRMLWELAASGITGAVSAGMAGGSPIVGGAFSAILTQIPKAGSAYLQDFGKVLFRIGAFDLANRVRRETSKVEIDALQRLLSPDELNSLRS